MLLEAEFLAIVLVLVYVGAVMVLFLFVVMMLDVDIATLRAQFIRYLPLGLVIAAIMAIEIFLVVGPAHFGLDHSPGPAAGGGEVQQHPSPGAGPLYRLCLSVRDRLRHPAGGHRRRHPPDPAAPPGDQVPEARAPGARDQGPGPHPDRQDVPSEPRLGTANAQEGKPE